MTPTVRTTSTLPTSSTPSATRTLAQRKEALDEGSGAPTLRTQKEDKRDASPGRAASPHRRPEQKRDASPGRAASPHRRPEELETKGAAKCDKQCAVQNSRNEAVEESAKKRLDTAPGRGVSLCVRPESKDQKVLLGTRLLQHTSSRRAQPEAEVEGTQQAKIKVAEDLKVGGQSTPVQKHHPWNCCIKTQRRREGGGQSRNPCRQNYY